MRRALTSPRSIARLAEVWEPLLLPILERSPAVQAITLLRHLRMTDPEASKGDRIRRTLEQRVRDWRALIGCSSRPENRR